MDLDVYIGRAAGWNVSENGLGYDGVMRLMQPFLNQGYHLFVDNFYTSVTLFKNLFTQVPSWRLGEIFLLKKKAKLTTIHALFNISTGIYSNVVYNIAFETG